MLSGERVTINVRHVSVIGWIHPPGVSVWGRMGTLEGVHPNFESAKSTPACLSGLAVHRGLGRLSERVGGSGLARGRAKWRASHGMACGGGGKWRAGGPLLPQLYADTLTQRMPFTKRRDGKARPLLFSKKSILKPGAFCVPEKRSAIWMDVGDAQYSTGAR